MDASSTALRLLRLKPLSVRPRQVPAAPRPNVPVSKKASPLYYEEIGDDFEGFMSMYDVERRVALIEALLPERASEARCLEVGCGTGRISDALAARVATLTVLDISERLAASVGSRLGIAWMAGDACALPVPDASFDLVVSSECVEHTPDPLAAVRELARVLAPGGTLVLTTPNRLWYPALVVARALRLRKYAGTENWTSAGEVTHVLTASGLVVDTVTGCHLFPWQLPGARRVLPWFDRYGTSLHRLMINFAVRARRPHGPPRGA